MKKVLFGVTVPATANAFLRGQLVELSRQGWEVHLATAPNEGFDDLLSMSGVQIHELAMKRNPSPASDLKSLRAWIKLIKRINPDMVVSSTPKAGLLGMLAAKLQKTPIRVYHVRGLRAEGLSGLAKHVSLISEKLSSSCANAVLCDSPSLLSEMRRLKLLKQCQGLVLGSGSCCGVDTENFRPPTLDERRDGRALFGITQDELVIGFVGRITQDKGVRELIEAAKHLRVSNKRIRLLLVGPTEVSDSTDLAVSLKELAGSSWVTLTGSLSDTRPAYQAMDIFCSPSYREGFPIAILEAQASGLPVVTSNATGCIDAIRHEVTGICVEPRNIAAIESALASLLHSSTIRNTMSSAARMRAITEFDQNLVEERFIQFLELLQREN